MVKIDDKLNEKYRLQKDGVLESDEEMQMRMIAQSYALCEHSIAVLSNLRTDQSHIYYGGVADVLGFSGGMGYQTVDSVWEMEIYERIHPDDWSPRCLQELTFFRMVSSLHTNAVFAWHMENTMRMRDLQGNYHNILHRIFYFKGANKQGICYSLCLYNLALQKTGANDTLPCKAHIVNTLTGERRDLQTETVTLLTDREKMIIRLIREGRSSKEIATHLGISKNTVDRHRQNIIARLQVSNTTEACHKAKMLGLID